MKPTALGDYVGIVYIAELDRPWLCVAFDARGNWRSISPCSTREKACEERRRWRAHHAKRAQEQFARRAARLAKRSG